MGGLKVSLGALDRQSPAHETIRSFFTTSEGSLEFAGFVQEILSEDILLAAIVQRELLRRYFALSF